MSDYAVLLEEIADREAEARVVKHRAGERTISVVGCDAGGGALDTGKMVAHVLMASWGMCCYYQSSLMKMIHVSSLPLYPFLLFVFLFVGCKFCEKGLGRKSERKNDVTELKGKLAFGA